MVRVPGLFSMGIFAAELPVNANAVQPRYTVAPRCSSAPPWLPCRGRARGSGTTAYTFVHEWWHVTIPCGKVG